MKKGDRRRHNRKRNLTDKQIAGVHKIRKKLRKNPAFEQFKPNADGVYSLPPGMVDAACDMAVLMLLKQFGVSFRSILNVVVPIVEELLDKHGVSRDLPLGSGLALRLERTPELGEVEKKEK